MAGRGFLLPLAVLYGTGFLGGFNENLVNTALVAVMAEYGIDAPTAQWLVTGYMIVATVGVSCMAFVYRRVRLRVLFFAASGLSLAGSVMGAVAPSFAFLLVARLVQALGTGIFIPMMMNTTLVLVPRERLGTFMSIGSCMITFGPALAPVVCGGFVTAFGWHSIFVLPTVASALLAGAGFFLLRDVETSEAHLDVSSVALSAVAITALSFGLVELTGDPLRGGVALAAAVAVGVLFVVRQLRCVHPLIDLALMRRREFWPSCVLVVVAMMTTFSLSVLLPMYFEQVLGMTAFLAGLVLLAPVLANAASSLVCGRLLDRYGAWPLIPIGFASIVVGVAGLAIASAMQSFVPVLVGAFFSFAGVGAVFSASQTTGLRTVTLAENAFGVALQSTFVQIAACVGPSLYIGIMSTFEAMARSQGTTAQAAAASGFSTALAVAAIVAAAGLVTAALYTRMLARRNLAKA